MIEPGQQAPDFELPDQDGNPVKLSDLRGRPVVVYFYPKAETSGCTVQACGVRDHRLDYEKAGAVVLGISPDPVKKIKRFHDKQGLNFALLADEDHAMRGVPSFTLAGTSSPLDRLAYRCTAPPAFDARGLVSEGSPLRAYASYC